MLSDRERQWIGDILRESAQAIAWLGDQDAESFEEDARNLAAVERKVMNVTEACLRIERGRGEPGRFAELFPGHEIEKIRGMGNILRHGYDDIQVPVIYDTVKLELPQLHARSKALLDLKANGADGQE